MTNFKLTKPVRNNALILAIKSIRSVLFLFLAASLLCFAEASDIQKKWINELLAGKDMSELSANFSDKKVRNTHYTSNNNPLVDYEHAEGAFFDDLNKLIRIGREFEPKHQVYIEQKYLLLKKQKQKLSHWLNNFGVSHDTKNASITSRVDTLNKKVNKRWQAVSKAMSLPVESWGKLTLYGLEKVTETAVNSTQENYQQPIILRNDRLPYDHRNFSAPILEYGPEVSPSYADSDASAGQVTELQSDHVVNVSPEIFELAASLDHDYIKIYNFVRLQISEQYYAGSMKGSQGTLLSYAGNDVDQAALLMALLRASNIPSRFVKGVIQQRVEKVANGLGLSDSNQVLEALNRAGIAHEPVVQGGQITAIRKQYTWVSAYVPYANYRGSANDLNDPVWIPLAPAIKDIFFSNHEFDYGALDVDGNQLVMDYLVGQDLMTNTSPINYWKNELMEAYSGDYEDLLVEIENVSEAIKVLPASLPFEVITTTYENAELPTEEIHQLSLTISYLGDEKALIEIPFTQVAGRRVSLSYLPATVDDLNIINQAGGMAQVPPYLVDLRPVVKVDGIQLEVNSETLPMAAMHDLTIRINSPSGSISLERNLLAGTYMSLLFGTQDDDYPLNSENVNLVTDETKPIRLMHNLGVNYNTSWNTVENELAAVMNHSIVRPLPSVVLISPEFKVSYSQGLPVMMQFAGVSIDAVSRTVDVISRDQNETNSWVRISALQGSWLESAVFDSQWSVNAVSADQGLRSSADEGQIIHHFTPLNYESLLASINHPDYIKQHIGSWVSNGYHALISQDALQQQSWQGSVWTVWQPDTGTSGYFISGGYAGGQTTELPEDWDLGELSQMLNNPYAEGVNENPLGGRKISKINETDNQYGVVNEEISPSKVLVTDIINRPVTDARVIFTVTDGFAGLKGQDGYLDGSLKYVETLTNYRGIAEIALKFNTKIGFGPQVLLQPNDENLTQLGSVILQATVITDIGQVSMSEPFKHYAVAGEPAEILLNDCNWFAGSCEDFSSHQDMQSGNVYVVVTDQYLNPVSNIPVTIEGMPAIEPPQNKSSEATFSHQNTVAISNKYNKAVPTLLSSKKVQSTALENVANNQIIGSFTSINNNTKTGENNQSSSIKSSVVGRCDEYTPARIAVGSCADFGTIDVPGCASSREVIESDISWSMFSLYNGHGRPATEFPVKISVPGLDDKFIYRYNGFKNVLGSYDNSGVFYAGDNFNGPNGKLLAGKVNNQISSEVTPIYLSYASDGTLDGCVFVQANLGEVDNMSTEPLIGGAAINLNDFGLQWPEKWDVTHILGDSSEQNINRVTANDATFEGVGIYPGNEFTEINYLAESATVSANVIGRQPSRFVLNDDSITTQNSYFIVGISPSSYFAESLVANFYEGESIIYTYSIKYPSENLLSVVLPVGTFIDSSKDYSIELILNEGADYEVKFDRQDIEGIDRKLVKSIDCDDVDNLFGNCGDKVINNRFNTPVRISTTLDFANDAVCKYEGFTLDLLAESRVSIEAFKHDVEDNPTDESIVIYDNQLLPAGESLIDARAETFGTGKFTLKITAIAEDNGDEEEVFGLLVSTFDHKNSLPIGHAIVKGVDLADGSMVYSKKDISVSSPGVDLEFVRTYSSQARHDLGPLGYGWSYNYMSRVVVGNCDQVIVTGADGGSARFRKEADQYIPLKGYHSSLIKNSDGSFDFYPKGGNRYHYIKMQNRVWWMQYVEDPNGNRLTVELLPRNNTPIIRSVTDSVGRQLLFEYQGFKFGNDNKEMLVRVIGSGGMNLEFEYDIMGNLVSAQREGRGIGGTTDEMMTYSGELTGPSKSLLYSVTDNTSGATRSWNYQNKTYTVPPLVATVPDMASIEVVNLSESDAGATSFEFTSGVGYNLSASISQNGQVSTYHMNGYGAATQIVSPAGIKSFVWETDTDVLLMSETDENSRLRSFKYDSYGNVVEERLGTLLSTYTYHDANSFDPPFIKDRIEKHTNWRGIETSYVYDQKGNKSTESRAGVSSRYQYNDRGFLTHYTDGRGLTTVINYDDYGYQSSVRNPEGIITQSNWNIRGLKMSDTDGNGEVTGYIYDDSDRMTVKLLNDKQWTYEYQDGGKTRIETDPNQNATRYTYDTQGRLLETINALSDVFSYEYDLNGNKVSENDFGGHITSFEYDDTNRLTRKTEPQNSAGELKITTYTYDNVGNVLSETTADRVTEYGYEPNRYFQTSITRKSESGDAVITRLVDGNGNVLNETDPMQNSTTYTYDAFDRLLTMSGPLGSGQALVYDENGNVIIEEVYNEPENQLTHHTYDLANRLQQTTLAMGGKLNFSYDGSDNVLSENKPNGYSAVYSYNDLNLPVSKNINGYTWLIEYDDVGNITKESGPFENGQVTGVTNYVSYTYDQLNRQLTQVDGIGLVSSQTYDADSNVTSQTDGNGQLTEYKYNGLHQRIHEIAPLGRGHTYTYSDFGDLLTDTGPNGPTTHTYDQLGRKVESTGPEQYHMVFAYDLNGNMTSRIDSRGIETVFGVNELNQTISQVTGSFTQGMTFDLLGNLKTQTDYAGILSEFTHDLENRQTSFSRASVLQNTTTYNLAGMPVIIKDAKGYNTVQEYNNQYHKTRTLMPESQVIVFDPNAYGDVSFQNNPGPNDINRTFDARRRLLTETNGAVETTSFEYDLNNNRTAVIKPGGQRWEYDFDAANRLTHVRNVPELIETIYAYDAADNLISVTDAEQKTTQFTFDNRNRKTSKIYPGELDAVIYSYDPNNNIKSIDYPNGVNVDYEYDDLNRQYQQDYSGTYGTASVNLTLDGNGNVEQVAENIDGIRYNYSMSYDDLDRMESKTDRYGNTFFYGYDANGNRELFRDHDNKVTNYSYDKLNRLKQMSQAGLGAFEWSYNSAGLPQRIDYPNGSEANYLFDNANRIALIDNKQSGVTVTSHAYEYGLNGNREKLTESNIGASQVTDYFYDDADRLIQTNYPTYSSKLTLDKVGNRDQEIKEYPSNSENNKTFTYSYNNRDQLLSVTDEDVLNVTYDYDAFGNQTEKTENNVITTFEYTARQRVKSITKGTASPNEYQYDYAGQRVNSQSNGMEKHFLYDGLTLVAETNAIGNTLATYHYGQRRQLAETRNTTNSYYLADALGTNVAITNQDGSIQNRMDYDVWGNLNQETASSDSPFGFTGYIKDDDTDLYYANARYYDSFTGRFLREDPLEGDVNTPASLHRYMYGYANPTTFIDPTGNANDTSHYYEALLIGNIVGLNEGQMLAYAIGAQIGDEFAHHDAVHNSIRYVESTFAGNYDPEGFGNVMSDNIQRSKTIYQESKQNNCGAHALCGTQPSIVRDAVTDYTMKVAQNFAEIGTADHTNTDSYFHIVESTLGTKNEISHRYIKGHLLGGTNTDKSYLYHKSKRIKAFRARAWLLFEYTVQQGTQRSDRDIFEMILNKAVADLDQLNDNLHAKYENTADEFSMFRDRDFIKYTDEFDSIRGVLKSYGITSFRYTELHDPNENIDGFLKNFSHNQLKAIALEIDPRISVHLDRLEIRHLVSYLSSKFDMAQQKSKEFIYNKVQSEKNNSDTVTENTNKPGAQKVSK